MRKARGLVRASPWGAAVVLMLFAWFAQPARAGGLGGETYPVLKAAPVGQPPVIDGKVEEAEWPVAEVTGMLDLGSGMLAREQPVFFVAYDARHFYAAGRLPLAGGAKPRAAVGERDGPVWEDDAVEVFLDVGHSHRDYFQIVVNAGGVAYDGRGREGAWNSHVRCAAQALGGEWDVELAIAWSDLGLAGPPVGETMGFNLCWDRVTPAEGPFTWAPVRANFHEPGHFGHLTLDAGDRAPRVTSLGQAWTGR